MDAWIYSTGTLASDEGEPTSYVAEKMLEIMGFKSSEDFNKHLSLYKRGELPRELQIRIMALLDLPDANAPRNDEEDPEPIIISNGIVESLEEPVELQNPFACCGGPDASALQIYGMSFEPSGDYTSISLRLGISVKDYLSPRDNSLELICDVLIEKIIPLADETLFNQWDELSSDMEYEDYQKEWLSDSRETIAKWLSSQSLDGSLAHNDSFLAELGQQLLYLTEGIGITTRTFVDDDGTEHCFWIEGEEESGLDDD
jgi:hypothetical protein